MKFTPSEGFMHDSGSSLLTHFSWKAGNRTIPLTHTRQNIRTSRTPLGCSEKNHAVKISVCNGPTCSKDGSANIRGMLTALGGEKCTVDETGCLGECGQGPNTVVFESGSRPKIVRGVQSSRVVCSLLRGVAVAPEDEVISAVRLKERADEAQVKGKFSQAATAYQEAVKRLHPFPQLYIATLCNWSKALASAGDSEKAVAIANQAVDFDPSRPSAWRRKAEAHQMSGERDAAMTAWETWGRLSGRVEEAKQNVRSLKRRRIFGF